MDKLLGKGKIRKKKGFFARGGANDPIKLKNFDKQELFYDILLFTVGFLLSRCHLFFGAHPLAIAFVAALPFGVWSALLGAAIGAISMGMDDVIFAAVTAIVAFLRAAVSGGRENGGTRLFGENLLMRMSISILCGFVSAVYRVLLYGFSEGSILFGLCMVILPPFLTFIFSGLFSTGVDYNRLFFGSERDFFQKDKENDVYEKGFFFLCALMLMFFIGLSFKGVNILGISITYVFGVIISLICAKRFGAFCAMAVAFACTLSGSGINAVAFAIAGLCAGAIFGIGNIYAITLGGVALCAFSAYTSGISGLLSALPEFLVASTLSLPLLKRISKTEDKSEPSNDNVRDAEEMVGIMALAFQKDYCGSVDAIGQALSSMSSVLKLYADAPGELSLEEYRDIVISVAEGYCVGCDGAALCAREDIRPCIKNADKIAASLKRGKKITGSDVNSETEFCRFALGVAQSINVNATNAERERYLSSGKCSYAEDYALISQLVEDAKAKDLEERLVDNSMTDMLTEAMHQCGLEKGSIRAFGKRRKHFIVAGEDVEGNRITSFELRKKIEEATKLKLSTPEYFRRGKMALMECGVRAAFSTSFAVAKENKSDDEESGDNAFFFQCDNDYFYSLISDGMGSGEIARQSSEFVGEFIKCGIQIGAGHQSIMHLLNRAMRGRREECSATVDMMELDLLTGQAGFIKSGAAPSFIKRGSSIFRICSHTAPIGLMSTIDCERIKADLCDGDYVIMISDGVADESDDMAWLLLLLGEADPKSPKEYANLILREAKKNRKTCDDMTVAVVAVRSI